MAVVADASELKIDPIVDGAFAGKPDLVETEFAKAMVAGTYPGMIISAAQRQAAWLHKTSLAVAEGTPVSTLLDSGFPRLHFSRKPSAEIALRNFSTARLVGDHRTARDRGAGDAQAVGAGGRDRAARAAVDRGECEAAGVSDPHLRARAIRARRVSPRECAGEPPQRASSSAYPLRPAVAQSRRAVRGRGSGCARCRRDRGDRR